jgi:hypothetical protein
MSRSMTTSRAAPRLGLDTWAVIAAAAVLALVGTHVLPSIPW